MPSTSPTRTRKRLGALLAAAALVGLLLGLTLGCYKPQFKEAKNTYCLRDSDCASGLQCVAQFCQRDILSAAEYKFAAEEAAAEAAAAQAAAGPTPADALVAPVSPTPRPSVSSERPLSVDLALVGDYYALVVGNNAYFHYRPLRTAVKDAQAVARVLRREYNFRVTLLINATREEMVDGFDEMMTDLGKKDNLLIYYAGHGYIDKDTGQAYWLPIDAKREGRARWVALTAVRNTLKGMASNHVMVVADSCFSGALLRDITPTPRIKGKYQAYIERMLELKSRTALTAGGLTPVEDAGGGGHSVFAKYFLRELRENQSIIGAGTLAENLKIPVRDNADQTPEYGTVHKSGHEGGDFVFVRTAAAKDSQRR